MTILQMFLGGGQFQVDSADFDGTNDWMPRASDLDGNSDSKSGILSCWIRFDGGDGVAQRAIANANLRFNVTKAATTNIIGITGRNAAGTIILQLLTDTAYTASATWLHFLVSWNLATAAAHLYVNDSDDIAAGPTLTDDTIDYTQTSWGIGSGATGSEKLDGCLAEFYFAPGQYIDLSVETNRRRFISAGGKPVYLGSTGSAPTGTAPIVYQHLDNGEAVASFATNRGTGGDFTVTGTLTTGSTSPSD